MRADGTFLGINEFDLDASEPEVVLVMLDLAASKMDESQAAEWIRERWIPVQTD